jgi:diadenylate cyclase
VTDVVQTFRSYVEWALANLTATSVVDVLVVALIFYLLLFLIRGTQAVQLLRGTLLLILGVVLISNVLNLTAFNWLIRNSIQVLLVAIPVIFQPELRRALERLGRAGRIFGRGASDATLATIIENLTRAAEELSERRHGALIVLEQETGLQEIIKTGMALDAALSADLLLTIFFPKTALHDGAVIVRGDRILAARCVLPMPEIPVTDAHLGTRHLAAIGLTEQTDAIVIVVSEETGTISVARNGRIVRHLERDRLARMLYRLLSRRLPDRIPHWLRPEAEPAESSASLAAEIE